jgi:hypothetical protein
MTAAAAPGSVLPAGRGPRTIVRMSTPRPHADRRRLVVLVAKGASVVVVSLALGGLTSPAQGWLPDPLRPFANSASGWTLLTALVVWAVRERAVASAVFGFLSFIALVLGYQTVSDLRGAADTEGLFLAISFVAGPVVGLAACWVRRRDVRAALACGVLAGIGIGDGASGLLRVAATTGWFSWTLIAVIGAALVVLTEVRIRGTRDRLVALAATVIVAAAYVGVFAVL